MRGRLAAARLAQRCGHRTREAHAAPARHGRRSRDREGRTHRANLVLVSFDGRVYPIDADAQQATAGPGWWLASDAERKAGWRPGGVQPFAENAGSSRLYAIMHRGALSTHKDPGKDVWVFDVAAGSRVQQFSLRALSSAIQISSDDHPLLYSVFIDAPTLDICTTPTVMVTP